MFHINFHYVVPSEVFVNADPSIYGDADMEVDDDVIQLLFDQLLSKCLHKKDERATEIESENHKIGGWMDGSVSHRFMRSLRLNQSSRYIAPSISNLSMLGSATSPIISLSAPHLQALHCPNVNMQSLQGIASCATLSVLDASETPISGLQELAGCCPLLRSLHLQRCQYISSLEGLEGHECLNELDVSFTNIATLEPIMLLPQLQTLDVSHCKRLLSLSAEEDVKRPLFSSLRSFRADGAGLKNIRGLQYSHWLRTLSLQQCKDLTVLCDPRGWMCLESLNVSSSGLVSLEPLDALLASDPPHLHVLGIGLLPVKTLPPRTLRLFRGCLELEISMKVNRKKTPCLFNPLESFFAGSITSLELLGHRISSFEFNGSLLHFPVLVSLTLSHLDVNDLRMLSPHGPNSVIAPSLRRFAARFCDGLRSLTGLEGFAQLESLDLHASTNLLSLDAICSQHHQHLTSLIVSHCSRLTRLWIDEGSSFPRLREIDVSYTAIASLDFIKKCSGLLLLRRNCCQTSDDAR